MTVLVWTDTFVAETMWPSSRAFSSHELVTSGRLEGRLIDSGSRAREDAKQKKTRGEIPRFGFVRFPAGHDVAMGKRFGIARWRDRELTATGVAAAKGASSASPIAQSHVRRRLSLHTTISCRHHMARNDTPAWCSHLKQRIAG